MGPTCSLGSLSVSACPQERLNTFVSDWKEKQNVHSPNNNRGPLNQCFRPRTKEGRINFNSAAVDYRRWDNNSASTSAQRGANLLLRCTPAAPLSPPPTNITILNVNPGRVTFVSARPPNALPQLAARAAKHFVKQLCAPRD